MKEFFATLLFGIGCMFLGLNLIIWLMYLIGARRDPDMGSDGTQWFVGITSFATTLISVIFFIGYTNLMGWTAIGFA